MSSAVSRRFRLGAIAVATVSGIVLAGWPAAADGPLFAFAPLTATSLVVAADASATVRYLVTNNAVKPYTLAIQPVPGISQVTQGAGTCAVPFTLAAKQSCVLALSVSGAQLPAGGVKGGPVVCQTNGPSDPTPNPLACWQPAAADALDITRTASGSSDAGDDASTDDASVDDAGDDASTDDASVDDAGDDASGSDAGADATIDSGKITPEADANAAPAAPAEDAAPISASAPTAESSSSCAASSRTPRAASSVAAIALLGALALVRRRRRT